MNLHEYIRNSHLNLQDPMTRHITRARVSLDFPNLTNLSTFCGTRTILRSIIMIGIALPSLVWAGDLSVTVTGIRGTEGKILGALYDTSQSFSALDLSQAVAAFQIRANEGEIHITLHDMAPGSYAVAVIHDENNNGKHDWASVLPIEGFGFSNNVGRLAFPSFESATIEILESDTHSSIKMNYLL